MKAGPRIRLTLDAFLAGLLFVSLAYPLTGGGVHEAIGAGILAGGVVHNLIHWRWYRALVKTPAQRRRVVATLVNLLLLTATVAVMASGMMMSRVVFPFLAVSADLPLREIHTLSAHWFLVLASVHLGLHWTTVAATVGRAIGLGAGGGRLRAACSWIAWTVAVVYGAWAFIDTDLAQMLVGYYGFGFWNFDEFPAWFFIRQAAIMGLIVFLVHHAPRIVRADRGAAAFIRRGHKLMRNSPPNR